MIYKFAFATQVDLTFIFSLFLQLLSRGLASVGYGADRIPNSAELYSTEQEAKDAKIG